MNEDSNRTMIITTEGREVSGNGPLSEPPVRVVPTWASPPDTHVLVMLGDTAPEVSAQLRIIRHRLEQKRADGMWVFGITSAGDGEGKTTFATQLALVLSESQRARVLLVEANFLRPALAKTLGFRVPEGYGFSTQLVRKMRGNMDPWCVVALGPALHVLAESKEEPGFPETLHSTHFVNAIGFLARGYDFLVVDGPSILGSGDANVVENAVDGMILTAKSGVTRGSELREAVAQLGDKKAIGVVLWDAEESKVAKKRTAKHNGRKR